MPEEWSRGQESPALTCHTSFTILEWVTLVMVITSHLHEDLLDIFVLVANTHLFLFCSSPFFFRMEIKFGCHSCYLSFATSLHITQEPGLSLLYCTFSACVTEHRDHITPKYSSMPLPTHTSIPFTATLHCNLSVLALGSIREACLPIPSPAYLNELAYWCKLCHRTEVFGKIWLHPGFCLWML